MVLSGQTSGEACSLLTPHSGPCPCEESLVAASRRLPTYRCCHGSKKSPLAKLDGHGESKASGAGRTSWLSRSPQNVFRPSIIISRHAITSQTDSEHLPTMLSQATPRVTLRVASPTCQVRHASLLRRPKRPYTFTQLVTLSDGSTFVQRTTSPQPVYRSTKDVRNSPLWNPTSEKLLNVEEDEAGRLKRFRGRFGRGWDAETVTDAEEVRSVVRALLCGGTIADSLADEGRRGGACTRRGTRISARPDRKLRQRGRGPRHRCWNKGGRQIERQGQGRSEVVFTTDSFSCFFMHSGRSGRFTCTKI